NFHGRCRFISFRWRISYCIDFPSLSMVIAFNWNCFCIRNFKCDLTSYFLPNYWKENFQDDTNPSPFRNAWLVRSEEHTSELQSRFDLVCRLLLEKKKKKRNTYDKTQQ